MANPRYSDWSSDPVSTTHRGHSSVERIVWTDDHDRIDQNKTSFACYWCFKCCIVGSLLAGIGLAIVLTFWLTSKTAATETLTPTTVTTATATATATTTTITDTTSTSTTSTTETTTTPYSCGNMTILLNTDILGSDISSVGGTPWASCCELCLADSACESFTLAVPANTCYLKTTPTYNGTYSSTHMSARY
ncbi:unnamed protein product [Adineta steineri]|uniref:Apple domain-containing protein n=1 Tax=Adineta steineri TaxID=433720 RepID=A0A814FSR8_9BILA|nr:unnamed protein product [Adineta steineri]CAF4149105.1 unnamed protein product [Adineta steineri]